MIDKFLFYDLYNKNPSLTICLGKFQFNKITANYKASNKCCNVSLHLKHKYRYSKYIFKQSIISNDALHILFSWSSAKNNKDNVF